MLQKIAVSSLLPHPMNSNRMDGESLAKLRQHIERTGTYEPLTVRYHPTEQGSFQVINGHHRLRVLRSLEHQMAECIVWDVDDAQTRLYLATLNRLAGQDVPERRAVLLDSLFGEFEVSELADLLPESSAELERLLESAMADIEIPMDLALPAEIINPTTVTLEFMLDRDQADVVNRALDCSLAAAKGNRSRSEALVDMCRWYADRADLVHARNGAAPSPAGL